MAEALFTINLKGELVSARYYTIDDDLLKRNILDEALIDQILERAENPDKWEWSFERGSIRVDILSKNDWRIDFFVSKNYPVQMWSKYLVLNPDKATFH